MLWNSFELYILDSTSCNNNTVQVEVNFKFKVFWISGDLRDLFESILIYKWMYILYLRCVLEKEKLIRRFTDYFDRCNLTHRSLLFIIYHYYAIKLVKNLFEILGPNKSNEMFLQPDKNYITMIKYGT